MHATGSTSGASAVSFESGSNHFPDNRIMLMPMDSTAQGVHNSSYDFLQDVNFAAPHPFAAPSQTYSGAVSASYPPFGSQTMSQVTNFDRYTRNSQQLNTQEHGSPWAYGASATNYPSTDGWM